MESGGVSDVSVSRTGSDSVQRNSGQASTATVLACIELVVCPALGVTCNELRARTRSRASVAFARQVAMYLAHVVYGMSLKEAAALFYRDRTTASHACSVIEDRRDDPTFDTFMEHIELAIIHLRRAAGCRDYRK